MLKLWFHETFWHRVSRKILVRKCTFQSDKIYTRMMTFFKFFFQNYFVLRFYINIFFTRIGFPPCRFLTLRRFSRKSRKQFNFSWNCFTNGNSKTFYANDHIIYLLKQFYEKFHCVTGAVELLSILFRKTRCEKV